MGGLLEFVARFGTEERCIEHLAGLHWPGGFVCAECGGREAWRLKTRPRAYECSKCHRQASVTAGTVFHRTRTDLTKWFLAAYLMGRDKRGVSAKFLQRELGVAYQTAWTNCSQAAPRAERGSRPSAARLPRGGRDLYRWPGRSDKSLTKHR
jgi:transposase-like protein